VFSVLAVLIMYPISSGTFAPVIFCSCNILNSSGIIGELKNI
jgi:hypothetical protein